MIRQSTFTISGDAKTEIRHIMEYDRDLGAERPVGIWAHKEPSDDELRTREILGPWFAHATDENGERIPLEHYLEILHEQDGDALSEDGTAEGHGESSGEGAEGAGDDNPPWQSDPAGNREQAGV